MKRTTLKTLLATTVALVLALALVGCGSDKASTDGGSEKKVVLKVGASPTPHAEILAQVKQVLSDEGIDLQVTEYDDYVIPNTAVDSGELDANFFQHLPYLEDFNKENGTDLVSVAAIHFEPLAIYPGKTTSLDKLAKGSIVAVPNDATNEARALLLLQQEGLLKLDSKAGISATVNDITENPLGLEFVEVEAAAVPRQLADVDIAVINGNYALDAGLSGDDALAKEAADSLAADTYANIVVVKAGNEDNEAVKALVKALQSDAVRSYIEKTYKGAVVPVF